MNNYLEKKVYPSRTICDVLSEARKCCETANYSYLPGLLEEVQHLANRMEASLEYKNSTAEYRTQAKEALAELHKIKAEIKKEKKE